MSYNTPHSNNSQMAAAKANWRMKTVIFCYRTGHLWDLVYVLYKLCTDWHCYTLEWNLDRSNYKIFCYAQNILYCNFDHISSDSFYLSLFNVACPYLWLWCEVAI